MNRKQGKNELCDCSKETGRVKSDTCKATGGGFNIMAMMNMLMGMGQGKKKGTANDAAEADAAALEAKHGGAFRTEALPEGSFDDLYHRQFGGVVSKNTNASLGQAAAIKIFKNDDCEEEFSPKPRK